MHVPVKYPRNKAPEELLTHRHRQLRYSAFNWANNVISPFILYIYIYILYLPNVWVHILKMLQ